MPHRPRSLLVPFAVGAVLAASSLLPAAAWAQTPPGYDVSWSALDPGDDWTAQVIRSVFPLSGAVTGGFATGAAATVIGTLVGTLTGFVSAVAMAFLCYAVIMQIYRGSETGRVLSDDMTTMAVVRLGVAAVMMYPLGSGFSAGQELVVRTALWGAGMARTVYTSAVNAIGPDSMVIAQPVIPGTKTIVLNLIQAELCRGLVNAVAAAALVPAPNPVTVRDLDGNGRTTWTYSLSTGNTLGIPACGTTTVREPKTGALQFAGVSMDMAQAQKDILTNVLAGQIRPKVEDVASQFWRTKQAASLAPLKDVLLAATDTYATQLAQVAQDKAAELRSALSDATEARAGNLGLTPGQVRLSSLGWSGAGAYYLEFARLNGEVLSLMSGVPNVNVPSYVGLSPSLAADVMPLVTSAQGFLVALKTYVQTTDGLDTPGGYTDALFSGTSPGEDGASTIEQVLTSLKISTVVLKTFVDAMSPTASNWTDPFGTLTQLGHKMVTIAVAALGAAGLLASTTTSALGVVGSVLTFNFTAAGAITVGHFLMSFLAVPIFMGLMGIMIPGLMLAFVLPMVPWVMWMAGVTGWLILVCEAVIAVPLWMLAHMTMRGEGLHGKAMEGYGLLFNVLFRPTLMIFGLFLSYFVFAASSWLIRMSFGVAAGFVLSNGWLVSNVLGVVVLLSIFVLIHIVAAVQSFRLISLLPHHLPRLVGFASAGRVDMDQFARDAAIIGVGATLTKIQQAGTGAVRNLSGPEGGDAPRHLLGSPGSSRVADAGGNGGMDSTLRAQTDNPGPTRESEEA